MKMNTTKLNKMLVDNVALPSIGIAVCLLLWCFLSWATWDPGAGASDFPSPVTTWNDSAKYFIEPRPTSAEEGAETPAKSPIGRFLSLVQYPFSRNEKEGFDGIGLEVWRSLKLVALGYGMAILAAVPVGFLLGGS